MIKEINRKCASGYLALVVIPALNILDAWLFYQAVKAAYAPGVFLAVLAFTIHFILLSTDTYNWLDGPNARSTS